MNLKLKIFTTERIWDKKEFWGFDVGFVFLIFLSLQGVIIN